MPLSAVGLTFTSGNQEASVSLQPACMDGRAPLSRRRLDPDLLALENGTWSPMARGQDVEGVGANG